MKFLKYTGQFFVLIAFAIFISTLFLNTYQLNDDALNNSGLTPEQRDILAREAKDLFDRPASKIKFIHALKQSLEKTNEQLIQVYSIQPDETDQLVKASTEGSGINYRTDLAAMIFQQDSPEAQFKLKGIQDYTSWIADRKYENIDQLKNDLNNAIANFNKGIVYQKGLDDYKLKSLQLDLTLKSGNGLMSDHRALFFMLTFVLAFLGALLFIIPKFFEGDPGIKNNNIFKNPLNARGWSGILLGSFLILFYLVLYFFPYYLVEWISLADVVSHGLFGRPGGQWFLYGFLYTFAVLVMGLRFLTKYRHNRYQQYRTASVMFFQLVFAFVLPQILFALNLPEVDLKNIWPLDYSFFYDWRIQSYQQAGGLGLAMMIWGIGLIVIGVPALTYFFGKRFYCSWVCGCGGLAETAGDPFRQLSNKKLSAWKIERFLIYSVLVFAVLMTVWVLYTTISGQSMLLGISSYEVRKVYGLAISSVFAGVVGTGFYPLMGNRVWCRFGCPLAAYMGIVQKFKSRFRITTNGGQCISCGNCSTHCEMGIDVRWYAQRGQNIVRASCVGCGVCAAVCPRGVLKLENREEQGRYNKPVLLGNDGVINIRAMRKSQ